MRYTRTNRRILYFTLPWGRWCSAVGKVTAGLAESNGSLPAGGWLIVTCGLTACTPGSAPGPTLGNEYGKPFPLPFDSSYLVWSNCRWPFIRNCIYSLILLDNTARGDLLHTGVVSTSVHRPRRVSLCRWYDDASWCTKLTSISSRPRARRWGVPCMTGLLPHAVTACAGPSACSFTQSFQ